MKKRNKELKIYAGGISKKKKLAKHMNVINETQFLAEK